MSTDHIAHAVHINLEEYFQQEFSGWDKIERGVLDPSKGTHKNKFDEHTDEMIDPIMLESAIKTQAYQQLQINN